MHAFERVFVLCPLCLCVSNCVLVACVLVLACCVLRPERGRAVAACTRGIGRAHRLAQEAIRSALIEVMEDIRRTNLVQDPDAGIQSGPL